MRLPVIILGVLVVTACAQSARSVRTDAVTDVVTDSAARAVEATRVMALERSIWESDLHRDRAGIDSLWAPDYHYLSARGPGVRSKAEDLAVKLGGQFRLLDYTLHDMRAAWQSPTALVLHYTVDQRFLMDGVPYCPRSGSTTAWAKRDGRWVQVARTEYLIGADRPVPCAPTATVAAAASPVPAAGDSGARHTWHPSTRVRGTAVRDSIGYPGRAEPFLYWYRAAAGVAVGAHSHNVAMRIRVLSGRKYILMGNPLDTAHVRIVDAGQTIVIPAGVRHVEWWEDDTIEEITGTGPLGTDRPTSDLLTHQ